jgi:hypothetical protein
MEVSVMKGANHFNPVNSSQDKWDTPFQVFPEGEEVLLADLGERESIDPMYEGLVDRDTGMGKTLGRITHTAFYGSDVTGGDIDDDRYQAEVVGEEAVGGQNPTPDQSVTEALLQSMGLAFPDGEPVRTLNNLNRRDRKRWELEPDSSEDYLERLD